MADFKMMLFTWQSSSSIDLTDNSRIMKKYLLLFTVFCPSFCFAQFEDLAQLGLKGRVESSLERFSDRQKFHLFRLFDQKGNILGVRDHYLKDKELTLVMHSFIYADSGELEMIHHAQNETPYKVENISHSGDTLVAEIITDEETVIEKRYFDKHKREYWVFKSHSTDLIRLNEDYLPVYFRKRTKIGDFESNYQVKVTKRDSHGNWLEAQINYNLVGTKSKRQLIWRRELGYFD